jgi:predicted metal-dependent phosphoesterase TrpH
MKSEKEKMLADLHIHSSYSNDGEHGVAWILDRCLKSGVDIFSITDHNSIRGSREAKQLTAGMHKICFLPGIEIDCNYKGIDLHLLAYQIDLGTRNFDILEKEVRSKHLDAVPQMIDNLDRLGIHINMEEVMAKAQGEVPSAELFAEVLLKNPDQHSNPNLKPYLPGGERSDMPMINFYLDFFAQGKAAYVKIEYPGFRDAIALVRDNGGIPIVAHPGLNLEGNEELVEELMDRGAAGLEVFNNYHTPGQTEYFARTLKKRTKLMTCGSDFHGKTKPRIRIGQYYFLELYREYLEQSLSRITQNET